MKDYAEYLEDMMPQNVEEAVDTSERDIANRDDFDPQE